MDARLQRNCVLRSRLYVGVSYLCPLILQTLTHTVQRRKHDAFLLLCLQIRLLHRRLLEQRTRSTLYRCYASDMHAHLQSSAGQDPSLVQCHGTRGFQYHPHISMHQRCVGAILSMPSCAYFANAVMTKSWLVLHQHSGCANLMHCTGVRMLKKRGCFRCTLLQEADAFFIAAQLHNKINVTPVKYQ